MGESGRERERAGKSGKVVGKVKLRPVAGGT